MEPNQSRGARNFLRKMTRTSVHSDRELVSYVVRITATCFVIAVAADAVNQLTFFVDWTSTLRSWTVTASLVLLLAGPISFAMGKAHLDLYRAKQSVERLSRIDPLTGLANRRTLIETAAAMPPNMLILVIFDIDRFKRVNDTYGHLVGDEVILTLSRLMVADLGGLGHLCRLGGEEFALLASDVNIEDVLDGVWTFRDHLAATPVMAGDVAVTVTISAGVAVRTANGTFNQLYADADRALYMAKAAGRNRVGYAESIEAAVRPRPEGERRRWRSGIDGDVAETEKTGVRSVA